MDYKTFSYDPLKNNKLKLERGIDFEDVIDAILDDKVIAVKPHHNKEKYQTQEIMVLEINNYIYLVPFIDNHGNCFLKTIYPSRKATAHYLKNMRNARDENH